MADVKAIMERQATLEARRSNWESLWEEVASRVFPRGDDFNRRHAPGADRSDGQFDAFPMMALNRFAAALESGLTPRSQVWHKLTTGEEDLDEDVEVGRYLDALNKTLWRARYAARANFSSQAHELYLGLGSFGTGAMYVEDNGARGIRYKSIHLGELYIAENADGVVDTVHRRFEMTARQAAQEFGDKIPEKVTVALEKGKTEDRFEFLHVVMPREQYDPYRLDADGLPWTDIYIHPDSKEIVRDGGFYEMPYCVSRYVTSSREIYGRSVAIMLLPDIKMLNEMRYTVIEAANMAVDPPVLLHDDGLLSEFRMEAGARNYGGVDDQGRQLAIPYDPRSRVDIGLEMIQDVKGQIDDGFLGVYFRVLLENPNMTATQALLIAQQQGQMTAPVIGRQQTEFLGPLIRRESGILFRQGRHPAMPEKLAEYLQETREPLGIEYESPMTRAAQAEDAVALMRTFEALAPWAQVSGPEVYADFNPREIARIMADVNGVPRKAIYSDEEKAAIEQQRAAQAEMATLLAAAPVAAETAKTLVEAQNMSQANPSRAA